MDGSRSGLVGGAAWPAAGIAVVVLGRVGVVAAVGLGGSGDDDGRTQTSPTATTTTVAGPAPGASLPMSEAPIEPRLEPTTVWTGSELIVWGGWACDETGCGDRRVVDGARYDPAADRWRPMAALPAAFGLDESWASAVAVWTGTEVVALPAEGPVVAYDPGADRWRIVSVGADVDPWRARWSGSEVVVLEVSGRLEALDPVTGTWRTLPPPPDRSVDDGDTLSLELPYAAIAMSGQELLVVEGADLGDTDATLAAAPGPGAGRGDRWPRRHRLVTDLVPVGDPGGGGASAGSASGRSRASNPGFRSRACVVGL